MIQKEFAQTTKEDGKVLVSINGKLVLEQDFFDLKTEVAGYTAPANVVYLYYGEEYKYWSEGVLCGLGNDVEMCCFAPRNFSHERSE